MRVSAKADYAVRAAIELAASDGERPVKKQEIVENQKIPPKFLENILSELRHAGLIESQRGSRRRLLADEAGVGDHGRRRDARRGGPTRERSVNPAGGA